MKNRGRRQVIEILEGYFHGIKNQVEVSMSPP